MNKDNTLKTTNNYYIVVEEWNYPTESGRNIIDDYDTQDEALEVCKKLAEAEEDNFEKACNVECLHAEKYLITNDEYGYIITPKNGLDPFYYATRIIKVTCLNC